MDTDQRITRFFTLLAELNDELDHLGELCEAIQQHPNGPKLIGEVERAGTGLDTLQERFRTATVETIRDAFQGDPGDKKAALQAALKAVAADTKRYREDTKKANEALKKGDYATAKKLLGLSGQNSKPEREG